MTDPNKETKTTIYLIIIAFGLNLMLGIGGSFLEFNSFAQIVTWQVADSLAIMGSVLSTRYAGGRGQSIAASGFTMLGIAFGISFASTAIFGIHEEKMALVLLPLVPAQFLISYCTLFPLWVRLMAIAVCVPFFFIYKNVIGHTYTHENPSNSIAYASIQVLAVIWSIYFYKDWKKMQK